jgi:hypothetical protein
VFINPLPRAAGIFISGRSGQAMVEVFYIKEVGLMEDNHGPGSFPPWSRIQGLDEMCEEAGVDFNNFIDDMKANVGIREMAAKHKVSLDTMSLLQEHFIKYGLSSVMGGD